MGKKTSLLDVEALTLTLNEKTLIHHISFKIHEGETVALVGESGSGKSLTAKAILGLVGGTRGRIRYKGRDILSETTHKYGGIRGKEIAFICQNPMTSLNPTRSIGSQLIEGLQFHEKLTKRQALELAPDILREVGMAEPHKRLNQFPDELSGGMRQRIVIAMALSCKPALLIADEPTTALDVTTQAQILDLLEKLQSQYRMSILLITHDLGIVARQSHSVYVLENGHVVEEGTPEKIFYSSTNNYTRNLCWNRL